LPFLQIGKNKPPSKLVAVVVPRPNRIEFTSDEEISLKHLVHFLGRYDKYLVVPESLKTELPGFMIKRFDNKFFGSIRAHRNLMLSEKFYSSFIEYKYILIYHLDALVFSDQLEEWCHTDFDYIGAPWIKHKDAPYSGNPVYEGKVGNGGFTLKKIDSFLSVLNSKAYTIEPKDHWEKYYASKKGITKLFYLHKKLIKYFLPFNNVKLDIARFTDLSEELFWVTRAKHYYPDFKFAPVETALRFAFESIPRYCYELNNHKLPFGCHGWPKYDRNFWEPYLLR
jgi:hypothetical protein